MVRKGEGKENETISNSDSRLSGGQHDSGDHKHGGRLRKYRNVPTFVGEIRFDSKKEAARWSELLLLERAGAIKNLQRQVPYQFVHNDEKIGVYKADFSYIENGLAVVEDVKSVATRDLGVYRLKKRLMAAFFGIQIRET